MGHTGIYGIIHVHRKRVTEMRQIAARTAVHRVYTAVHNVGVKQHVTAQREEKVRHVSPGWALRLWLRSFLASLQKRRYTVPWQCLPGFADMSGI
jgi:hypothetical protein